MTGSPRPIVGLIPPNEPARIAAVHHFEILDTPPDGAFDRITAIAARMFGVPFAIVTVVDTDRIWFKSHHGLPDVEEIGRDPGLCASAILQSEPWIVTNAGTNPRTIANPLVAGNFGLRFYAGAPLTTSDGFNLGTLCVLDTEPRTVTESERATLVDLAAIVVDQLELRLASRHAVEMESELRLDAERTAATLQASLLPPHPPSVPGMEVATRYRPGDRHMQVGGDFFDLWRLSANDWALVVGDACGKGPRAASVAALARWSVKAASIHHLDPSLVISDVNAVLRGQSDDDDHFCSVVFARLALDVCGAWVTLAVGGHPSRCWCAPPARSKAGVPPTHRWGCSTRSVQWTTVSASGRVTRWSSTPMASPRPGTSTVFSSGRAGYGTSLAGTRATRQRTWRRPSSTPPRSGRRDR